MQNKIALIDYDADWALKSRHLHPRTTPGYLEREQVIEFLGTLGVQGVELLHGYWEDYSPARLHRLVADAGLVVTVYLSFVDLALPPGEQAKAVDEVGRMLDRAAAIGAAFVHNVSFVMKENVPLAAQRAWIIAGLKQCAERARSAGVTLVCENLDAWPWRLITGRPADALDLWQQVGSSSFRLMYDCGNSMFADEDAVAALRDYGPGRGLRAPEELSGCAPRGNGPAHFYQGRWPALYRHSAGRWRGRGASRPEGTQANELPGLAGHRISRRGRSPGRTEAQR